MATPGHYTLPSGTPYIVPGGEPTTNAEKLGNDLLTAVSSNDIYAALKLIAGPDTDINFRAPGLDTPLILAARKGNLAVVKALLSRKDINVNAQNANNRTALMVACGRMSYTNIDGRVVKPFNKDIVIALLAHPEIKVELIDRDSQTALDYLNKYVPVGERSDDLIAALRAKDLAGGARRSRRRSRKQRRSRCRRRSRKY